MLAGDVTKEVPTAPGTPPAEEVAPAVMSVSKGEGVAVTVEVLAKSGDPVEPLKDGLRSTAGAGDTVLGLSWGDMDVFTCSLTNPPIVKDAPSLEVSLVRGREREGNVYIIL